MDLLVHDSRVSLVTEFAHRLHRDNTLEWPLNVLDSVRQLEVCENERRSSKASETLPTQRKLQRLLGGITPSCSNFPSATLSPGRSAWCCWSPGSDQAKARERRSVCRVVQWAWRNLRVSRRACRKRRRHRRQMAGQPHWRRTCRVVCEADWSVDGPHQNATPRM